MGFSNILVVIRLHNRFLPGLGIGETIEEKFPRPIALKLPVVDAKRVGTFHVLIALIVQTDKV